MKFYEFRYKKGMEHIAPFFNAISSLVYPLIIVTSFFIITNILGFFDRFPLWFVSGMYLIAIGSGVFFVIVYFINYKGVWICDEYIEVERYAITDYHIKPNFKIYYKDIKSIYSSYQRIPISSRKARTSIISCGDLDYYAEICLKGGKVFIIPVENQEEFVKEVIKRINSNSQTEDDSMSH